MEDQSNQYILELEKLLSVQIAMTYWAHNMDILVIVTQNNIIAGYRISFKAQRFFQIQQSQPIKSLCFSPDSQQIAYGLINGTIKIIKTQNGQNITLVDSLQSNEIFNLNFVEFEKIKSQEFIPFTKNSIENKLILNISPHKNCNKNAIIKINYFNELKENFTCLLLSQREKTWLLINGFIPIAYLNYSNMFQVPFRVLFSHFKEKIYSIIAEQVDCRYQLSLISFQAQSINSIKRDIIKYNCLITYISQVLNFVNTTYSTLQSSVRQIKSQYNRIKNLVDDSSSPNISPCQQLFRYLNTGVTSSALIHFLTKEIHDSKKLQKLDQTLTALFAQLHDIILESVQNSFERITIFLNKLISYSKVNKFKQFGVTTEELQRAQEQVRRLYVLGQVLLVQSTQTKFDIRNLLVWLNKATIKTVQDNDTQIQNTNSYLNKYTVDYNRLYRFLEDQSKFNLDHLQTFFKNEDKKPIKIPKPDFNLINKGAQKKVNPQHQRNYKIMQELLQVEDIELPYEQKMQIEESYKSFKSQMKDLIGLWKDISKKPVQYLSSSIEKQYQKNPIGSAELSEKYEFLFKPIVKDGQLLLYYVEREDDEQRLVAYNCNKKKRSFVRTRQYNILSLAVAEDIIIVLEGKKDSSKIVAQVANEEFDGSEIQFGRTILEPDQTNDLSINSSLRGLNSLIVGKTKLVIFD